MKKYYIILALIVIGFAGGFFLRSESADPSALDGFAKCLSQKGIVMYGADWCPHCQNEKKAFGESFKFVNYVECPDNPQKCIEARIEGYPTWIFPGGKRLEGEQGVEKLSQDSECNIK